MGLPEKDYFTIEEIADRLGRDKDYVIYLLRSGEIRAAIYYGGDVIGSSCAWDDERGRIVSEVNDGGYVKGVFYLPFGYPEDAREVDRFYASPYIDQEDTDNPLFPLFAPSDGTEYRNGNDEFKRYAAMDGHLNPEPPIKDVANEALYITREDIEAFESNYHDNHSLESSTTEGTSAAATLAQRSHVARKRLYNKAVQEGLKMYENGCKKYHNEVAKDLLDLVDENGEKLYPKLKVASLRKKLAEKLRACGLRQYVRGVAKEK